MTYQHISWLYKGKLLTILFSLTRTTKMCLKHHYPHPWAPNGCSECSYLLMCICSVLPQMAGPFVMWIMRDSARYRCPLHGSAFPSLIHLILTWWLSSNNSLPPSIHMLPHWPPVPPPTLIEQLLQARHCFFKYFTSINPFNPTTPLWVQTIITPVLQMKKLRKR